MDTYSSHTCQPVCPACLRVSSCLVCGVFKSIQPAATTVHLLTLLSSSQKLLCLELSSLTSPRCSLSTDSLPVSTDLLTLDIFFSKWSHAIRAHLGPSPFTLHSLFYNASP